jgi:hypothetical protein
MDAFIGITRRFTYSCEPVGGWDGDYRGREWEGVVKDGDVVIYRTEEKAPKEPRGDDERSAWYNTKDKLSKAARDWLSSNYPDWENPIAYWD